MDPRHQEMRYDPRRSVLRLAGTLLAAAAVLIAALAIATPDFGRAAAGRSRAEVTKALIGTWSLKSTVIRNQDGDRIGSLYEDPAGKLTYTGRGDMWAVVREREQTNASDSSVWYTGTFSVRARAKEVIHHVKFARPRSLEGTDQVRHYRLRKDRLVLSVVTPTQTASLRWARRR